MGIYKNILNVHSNLGAIFGGNSGYVGYSKSKRAVDAERRGLRSKSQMDKDFADMVNDLISSNGGDPVTLTAIKKALPNIKRDEWHHTSKYGNKTDYYSAFSVASYFCPAVEEAYFDNLRREFEKEQQQRSEREKVNNNIAEQIRRRINWLHNDFARFSTPYSNLFIEVKLIPNPLSISIAFVKERWSHVQNNIVRTYPGRENRNLINDYPLALPIYDKIAKEVEDIKKSI